ncbi:MAG: hypothetical protein PQJ28_02330 [Spirochaetales bacterium]|nr:hypothetical protein [Spirochaetales bacterium]
MDAKEHKAYLEEIKEYKERILQSDDNVKAFLQATGIYTKTGRLTRIYSDTTPRIGFKTQK